MTAAAASAAAAPKKSEGFARQSQDTGRSNASRSFIPKVEAPCSWLRSSCQSVRLSIRPSTRRQSLALAISDFRTWKTQAKMPFAHYYSEACTDRYTFVVLKSLVPFSEQEVRLPPVKLDGRGHHSTIMIRSDILIVESTSAAAAAAAIDATIAADVAMFLAVMQINCSTLWTRN